MASMQMAPRVQPDVATGDTGYKLVQGFRDGTISTVDWKQRMFAAGYGQVANMGGVVTPLTFLVTAANRPDAWLRVPATRAIIPVLVNVVLVASTGTNTNIDVRTCQNDIGNGTSTAATVGPINMRTDSAGLSSLVVPRHLATADTTAETNPVSVYRKSFGPISDLTTPGGADRGIEWAPAAGPLLVGASTLEVFVDATTAQATGYVIMQWIETPATWWT